MAKCLSCGRTLNDPNDPDSLDCGGDCKGCIDEAESACRKCGAQYEDGGDGYDGMCPSCADKAEGETND